MRCQRVEGDVRERVERGACECHWFVTYHIISRH